MSEVRGQPVMGWFEMAVREAVALVEYGREGGDRIV
jgi:hypothetical protein